MRGRVLVVDDEALLRRVLTRLLAKEHEVVTAGSGREGQALLEKDAAFDLILCDVMMPEMTGIELHAWLVQHDPALAARLVFISGGAFTPTASRYLESVSNARLEKPFDSAALKQFVSELVAAARRRRAEPGG